MHALVYFPVVHAFYNSPMGDIVEDGDIQGDQPGVFSGKARSFCSLHAEKVGGISSIGGDGFNQGTGPFHKHLSEEQTFLSKSTNLALEYKLSLLTCFPLVSCMNDISLHTVGCNVYTFCRPQNAILYWLLSDMITDCKYHQVT